MSAEYSVSAPGVSMAITTRSARLVLVAILSVIPVCGTRLQAEDVKLREQAVHLMEVASAVSLPGGLRNYEHVVTFRVHESDGTVKEGTFTRVSAGAAGHRDEITFGDYHAVIVISGDRISQTQTTIVPPEVRELRKRLPVQLGRFDKEDVIRSIDDANVLGRTAKCINFDTHFGATLQANQLCLDSDRGTLLRWQVGDQVIENADFFPIANLWEPAHIRRFVRGALQFEIDQRMTAIEGAMDPNVFLPPSQHWDKTYECRTSRRPVGISTPMPPAGDAGTDTIDVIVHGRIRDNGKVDQVQIQSSPRPELNAEALELVSTWKFLPLLCNDAPATVDGDFVMHFQGR
jgi:TonB family protein